MWNLQNSGRWQWTNKSVKPEKWQRAPSGQLGSYPGLHVLEIPVLFLHWPLTSSLGKWSTESRVSEDGVPAGTYLCITARGSWREKRNREGWRSPSYSNPKPWNIRMCTFDWMPPTRLFYIPLRGEMNFRKNSSCEYKNITLTHCNVNEFSGRVSVDFFCVKMTTLLLLHRRGTWLAQ